VDGQNQSPRTWSSLGGGTVSKLYRLRLHLLFHYEKSLMFIGKFSQVHKFHVTRLMNSKVHPKVFCILQLKQGVDLTGRNTTGPSRAAPW